MGKERNVLGRADAPRQAKGNRAMDVILQCGAHRTGAAGVEDYLRRHAPVLRASGVELCASREVHRALSPAAVAPACPTARRLGSSAERTEARVALLRQRAGVRGADALWLCAPSLLGGLQRVVESGALYPDAAGNVAAAAARLAPSRITLLFSIRSLERFWISALAQAVAAGAPVPDRTALRAIALSKRSWRDVICDIAEAAPTASIKVLPFEMFRARPERFASAALGTDFPLDTARTRLNRAPSLPDLRRKLAERGDAHNALPFGMGPWNPFCAEELAALREAYADDMMWLTAGAGGMAQLTEDDPDTRAGSSLPPRDQGKGQCNGFEERQMARPG
jgi:hypothetical protein